MPQTSTFIYQRLIHRLNGIVFITRINPAEKQADNRTQHRHRWQYFTNRKIPKLSQIIHELSVSQLRAQHFI